MHTKYQHDFPLVPSQQSKSDLEQLKELASHFENSASSLAAKIEAFPRFVTRQSLSRFISRYEVFKKVLGVPGSIIECGVFHGAGLFSFAKISSILEPTNHSRRIIGFDTFEGFPSVHDTDKLGNSGIAYAGAFRGSSEGDIASSINFFDMNRPLSHIPKVEIVKGDLCQTAKTFVAENPHLVVSLLNLDLDLFEPTLAALEAFVPCMPKGGVIIFDELNAKTVSGETAAVKKFFNLNSLKINRLVHDTYFSYLILE